MRDYEYWLYVVAEIHPNMRLPEVVEKIMDSINYFTLDGWRVINYTLTPNVTILFEKQIFEQDA